MIPPKFFENSYSLCVAKLGTSACAHERRVARVATSDNPKRFTRDILQNFARPKSVQPSTFSRRGIMCRANNFATDSMVGKSRNGSQHIKTDEYAVIGLGRFGTSVARTLVAAGHTVLGIDHDMSLVQRHSHEITHTAQLDSTDEEALKEINIESYGTVIVAIGTNFEANLMTSVALKEIGVRNVICKATTLMQRDILLRVGVDRVVLPEFEAGERLAMNITSPSVVSQIELCPGTRVSEVKVPDSMIGLTLEEIDLRNKYQLNVVAIQRGESVLVSPKKGSVLRKDDLMVVIGSGDAVQKLGSN